MNVIKTKPNSKRKIRSLPITENYLISEKSGMLRWAQPNESWRIFSPTGNQQCIIANIRFDDTDHSPDLWIYSGLKDGDEQMDHINQRVTYDDIFESNRVHLDRSRRWYIRQFIETPERIGVKRFTGLPFNAWKAMWRRTIPLEDIQIYGLSNNQMKIIYAGLNFNTFLKWPELQADVATSNAFITQKGTMWKLSNHVMPWLLTNCKGGFIPFSDYDTMFPDIQDDITYTIDVA
jgi:hypothetical protein